MPEARLRRPLPHLGEVHGYDQNASRRDDAADKGIVTHDHLGGVASRADVIILSLPHPDISIAVTTQIMAQPIRPKLVIETSTVTPQTAIDCAALAAAKNVGLSMRPLLAAWPAWRPGK